MNNSCKNYKLVFVTNLVNHHQIPLADCFYKILGDKYLYVSMEPLPQWLKDGGYSEIDRPYIARFGENGFSIDKLQEVVDNAEAVIIGSAPHSLTYKRQKQNKTTFFYNERWFKDGYYHLLSPRAWMTKYKDFIRFRRNRTFMLCASAFTASDTKKMFCFPNKTFKWGYFTKVPDIDIEKVLEARRCAPRLKILWVARFLALKHPELPVKLARKLKDRGIDFELNMYGSGERLEYTRKLIDELDLNDRVNLCGNLPNDEILKQMREHHIFLFTSDKNEGWGAVLNEAMSSGCAVIASDKIGAAPFLIRHNENGLIFKSENLTSLYEQVADLIVNPPKRENLARCAYEDMRNIWSPNNAADKFLKLLNRIQENSKISIEDSYGPCTKA